MKTLTLNEAVKQARRMLPRHSQYHYYPHFTFLYQDDKLVSCGKNSCHEPPKNLGYHKRILGKPKTHSEWSAYKKASRRLVTGKPFVCVNIRLNKKGELKFAKPCNCCYRVLKDLGCKTFYYSNQGGSWVKIG